MAEKKEGPVQMTGKNEEPVHVTGENKGPVQMAGENKEQVQMTGENEGLKLCHERKKKRSPEEKKVAFFLGQLGIKYEVLTTDELVTLMDILRKSKFMAALGSRRGKGGRKKK